jgi:hypothetical protein
VLKDPELFAQIVYFYEAHQNQLSACWNPRFVISGAPLAAV